MDIIEFRIDDSYFAPNSPLDEKVDIYINGRNLLDEIAQCERLSNLQYHDSDHISQYIGLNPTDFYHKMFWALEQERCNADIYYDIQSGDNEAKINATMLRSRNAVAWVDIQNTGTDYGYMSNLGYVFEKDQFERAVVRVVMHISDYDYESYNYYERYKDNIQKMVEEIVKDLKQIPSGMAPEDYMLDGYAWEEYVLQMGEGESIYWEIYSSMLYNMCHDVLDKFDSYEKELMLLKKAIIYDDMDISGCDSALDEARNEIIQDIYGKVLNEAENDYSEREDCYNRRFDYDEAEEDDY